MHACNTQVETRKEKKRKQRKIKKSKKTEKKIGKKTSKKKKKEKKYTTFAWVQYLGYYRRTITSYRVRDRLLEIYLAKLNHTCGLIDTKTGRTKLSNWTKQTNQSAHQQLLSFRRWMTNLQPRRCIAVAFFDCVHNGGDQVDATKS